MATAPYRQKWMVSDNVAESVRLVGAVTITSGAIGNVRPSAGSSASAGQGNLFTVTQPTNGVYQFTLSEQYYQVVSPTAEFLVAFATNGSTIGNITAQCTAFDTSSNSFCVNLCTSTGGALVTNATGTIMVELFCKPTAVPTSL